MNNDSGRILGELGLRTRQVVYGTAAPDELPMIMKVDRAHLVMLAERRLIGRKAAAALLRCLENLTPGDLSERPAPRGTYLMYEGYLIERLGPDVGGVLQTGRSRNDLKATITSLRCRAWLLDFAEQAIRLEAILLARARAHQPVVMPVYTHFQAAMPITYGYYLLGVARAVGREIDALASAAGGLHICPLGACAVAGTDLPIDPSRTASLLGYIDASRHALDAVASRDAVLRMLASAAGLSVVLSRLATDLQLWSTAEFGFIAFPDRLVGGSSAMPQKRNAFLLEHLKAKPGRAIAAWAGAASAMAATPFTNTIEVGTEAMECVWPGLAAVEQAVQLAQVVVGGARPNADRMAERAAGGFTTATALANRMVRDGVPFRTAHREVGAAVRAALDADATSLADLDLAQVVREQAYGGGPGSFAEPYQRAYASWVRHRRWCLDWRDSQAEADAALATAVTSVMEQA
ncbi:argininosuccinate lyase [Nonomuraea endophytica]|uniref:argininosuccinate lyase n=1 Tax=Nonomuraea endophytica TaxID=714136 RepID=UPI0037C934BD